MDKVKALWRKYKEGLLYLLFGGLTTLVNIAVYSLLIEVFALDMTLCNLFAWLAAVVFAFITNKLLVFESRSFAAKTLLKEAVAFFGARAVSGVLEVLLPTLLFRIGLDQTLFGVKGLVAKAAVSVLVILLNYVFSKWFIFKKR